MEDKTGAFHIEKIDVSNDEFKTDLSEGLIMEGIVNPDSDEIKQMSVIRKSNKDKDLEQALNEFTNTMTAYYLLVAITNKDQHLQEENINEVLADLDIFDDDDDGISGEATLNNVEYKSKENERGLVITASPKKDKKKNNK